MAMWTDLFTVSFFLQNNVRQTACYSHPSSCYSTIPVINLLFLVFCRFWWKTCRKPVYLLGRPWFNTWLYYILWTLNQSIDTDAFVHVLCASDATRYSSCFTCWIPRLLNPVNAFWGPCSGIWCSEQWRVGGTEVGQNDDKQMEGSPQSDGVQWKIQLKWMIWG